MKARIRTAWTGSAAMMIVALAAGRLLCPAVQARPPAAPQSPVQLPYTLRDNLGSQWVVQQDGSLASGEQSIYNGGGRLFVGPNAQYTAPAPQAMLDSAQGDLQLPAVPLMGLNVSRRISVDGKNGWCRFAELLENPSAAPIKTQVRINVELAGAVASATPFIDTRKSHSQVGLTVFDGNHGLAMVGAGRGSKLLPSFAPQQGNDTVDFTYEVEVPARQSLALVHIQAVRANADEATSFMQSASDADFLQGLPRDLLGKVANFTHAEKFVGDTEILRGQLLDVVELRGGDRYKGTLQDQSYSLQTPYGLVQLPAERVVAMLTVGDFRPTQLLVTTDGEAFGGQLQSGVVHLQLSSGQVTSIPLGSILRLGYRKRAGEAEEWKFDRPLVFLRGGDRIGIEAPKAPIPVATRYGLLQLDPSWIAALVLQSDEYAVHEVLLTDGSRFAGLVGKDEFDFVLRSIGPGKAVRFPLAAVNRLQFAPAPGPLDDTAAVLSLSNSDRLVGVLGGKVVLETAFDTIAVNGSEIRELRHGGATPTEVQVTLWDDATLSGRVKGDVLECTLKSGAALSAPVPLIDEYVNPDPAPPARVLEKIKALLDVMAGEDVPRAARAAAELAQMGPAVLSSVKRMQALMPEESRSRVNKLLGPASGGHPSEDAPATQPAKPADE